MLGINSKKIKCKLQNVNDIIFHNDPSILLYAGNCFVKCGMNIFIFIIWVLMSIFAVYMTDQRVKLNNGFRI